MVRALLLALLLLGAAPAEAHDVHHTVEGAEAVLLTLRYGDGRPFSFESYEISAEGAALPAQVGRTDAAGRIAFVAPAPGTYRCRAFSADGHGLDFTFEAVAGEPATPGASGGGDRLARGMLGVGILLALFGTIALLRARRST
jgi:nickel transport protein